MKKCKNTNKLIKLIHKRRSSANDSITSFVGAVTSLILLGVGFSNFLNLFAVSYVSATDALRLTISSNTLELNLMPLSSDGVFASSPELNINVTLSVTGGYTLGIKTANTGTDATKLINNADPENPQYFNPIPSAITESTFSSSSTYNNQWGYKPSKYNSTNNEDDYYYPMPSSDSSATLDEVSNFSGTNNYTLSIGARATNTTPIGQYSNTFIITAVSTITCNPNATTIGDAICMQDVNDDVINSMVEGTQYQLMDNRDEKLYYVAKMKDGRVWMTQNLDLDLRTDTTAEDFVPLTSKNTDLTTFGTQNYTTANGYTCSNASTTTNCTADGEIITFTPNVATVKTDSDYGANNNTAPASFDYGEVYRYVNTAGTTTSYTSTADCEAAHSDGTCDHYHVGNYYNFTASVASNSTSGITAVRTVMKNSICPAGWRLPNGITGTSSTDTGYYSELNYTWVSEGLAVNYVNGNVTATYKPSNATGWINIRNNPMYMVAAGYKNGTSAVGGIGSYGYYRTNTIYNGTTAYTPYFASSNLYPGYYSTNTGATGTGTVRGRGFSIRCIARQTNTGHTTVTFDKNDEDATGTMSDQVINANTWGTLTSNAYTKTGYTFIGWNTEPDGSGTNYANAAKYYAIAGQAESTLTLYAKWALDKTITFNANAPSGTTATGTMSDQTIPGNSSANLTANAYAVAGYAFNSWNTAADGSGTSYADGASYNVPADNTESSLTLYAQWDKVWTVTFAIGNGATNISFDGTTYTNGQTAVVIDSKAYVIGGNFPIKYGFNTWTTTANGTLGNSSAAATTYIVTGDATLTLTGQEATTDITTLSSSGTIPDNCANDTPIRNLQLVYDPRDNEAYWVAELCDGNVWMLDNLRLDLTNSALVGSLSSSNTNASDDILDYLKGNSVGTTSDQYPTAGIGNLTSGNSYSAPRISSSEKDIIAPVTYGVGSGKIGVRYNYCAVSAGSYCWGNGASSTGSPSTIDPNPNSLRDIEGDICPAGWHLPTSSSGGEYGILYNAYSGAVIGQMEAFYSAFSIAFSGSFGNGSGSIPGTHAFLRGSTWRDNSLMYGLSASSSSVAVGSAGTRTRGDSARCVLGSPQ